jgi:predicted DNA-binding transcriptional regulator AlpA
MRRTRKPSTPPADPGSPASPPRELTNRMIPERLALRLGELAKSLGVSRRTLERERSAGRFPPPDLMIGKAPLWKPETMRRWMDAGGRV